MLLPFHNQRRQLGNDRNISYSCATYLNAAVHTHFYCAIALGQAIVANMKQRDRDRLEALVKSDTTISQHRIRNLAIQNQVPESLEGEF